MNSKSILYPTGSNDECYTPMGGLSYLKIYFKRLGGLVSIRYGRK